MRQGNKLMVGKSKEMDMENTVTAINGETMTTKPATYFQSLAHGLQLRVWGSSYGT